jgi:hypothetical protein
VRLGLLRYWRQVRWLVSAPRGRNPGPGEQVVTERRMPPGESCQQPSDAEAAAFDEALQTFAAYGGTYWHRDGELRVRIAYNRADGSEADRVAREVLAKIHDVHGGIHIESTSVSLRDLYSWAEQAEDGLANIAAHDVIDTSVNELCQYVDVFVKSPATARLSANESSRYAVSAAPRKADGTRSHDESPYYGGVRLWYSPNGSPDPIHYDLADCTAGFTMLRSGSRYISTAGHCSDEADFDPPYYTDFGNYVGSEAVNPFECVPKPNDPCDRNSWVDIQLLANMTYHSPIWFGGWNTQGWRYVTAKQSLPSVGTAVWISGGNSGLLQASVQNRYDTCFGSPTVRVGIWDDQSALGGDSGSPVVRANAATARTDDVTALGSFTCYDTNDPVGYYTRVDFMEGATDSSLVLSNP